MPSRFAKCHHWIARGLKGAKTAVHEDGFSSAKTTNPQNVMFDFLILKSTKEKNFGVSKSIFWISCFIEKFEIRISQSNAAIDSIICRVLKQHGLMKPSMNVRNIHFVLHLLLLRCCGCLYGTWFLTVKFTFRYNLVSFNRYVLRSLLLKVDELYGILCTSSSSKQYSPQLFSLQRSFTKKKKTNQLYTTSLELPLSDTFLFFPLCLRPVTLEL